MNINATLIGQMIFFGIFVWFCMKYVWPPLLAAMKEREKKIADGLDAAARSERELEKAQQQASAEIRSSKQKAAEIIEMANKRAAAIVDEAKDKALSEAEKTKSMKMKEIEQAATEARELLRAQVSVLAVAGASKILEKSVDQSAHNDMLEKLAAEL